MTTILFWEGPGIASHSRCNVEMFNNKLDIGKDIISELWDRAEKKCLEEKKMENTDEKLRGKEDSMGRPKSINQNCSRRRKRNLEKQYMKR